MSGIVTLMNERFMVAVAPQLGGAIVNARWTGIPGKMIDLLRPAAPDAIANGDFRGMSLFAMIPFASFVRKARFAFQGEQYALAKNFPDRDIALHGDAWQSAWKVDQFSESSVTMSYRQNGDRFPFAYHAEQSIALGRSNIRISASVTNTDTRPMPAGCGFHPYFPKDNALVQFDAGSIWERDGEGMPVRKQGLPSELDFSSFRPLPEIEMNEVYADWDGRLSIEWRDMEAGLRMEASPVFRRMVLFAPKDKLFFCAEPVTNIPDAFNLMEAGNDDTGTILLEPGRSLAGSISLAPFMTGVGNEKKTGVAECRTF